MIYYLSVLKYVKDVSVYYVNDGISSFCTFGNYTQTNKQINTHQTRMKVFVIGIFGINFPSKFRI